MAAVKQSGQALELAAQERQLDRNFIESAVRQNPAALEFVTSSQLRSEVQMEAVDTAAAKEARQFKLEEAIKELGNGSRVKLQTLGDSGCSSECQALLVSAALFHGVIDASGQAKGGIASEVFLPNAGEILVVTSDALLSVEMPLHSVADLRRRVLAGTVRETLRRVTRVFSDRPCLGWESEVRSWRWLTYRHLRDLSSRLGVAMVSKVGADAAVGICGQNSISWVFVLLACLQHCLVAVPLALHFGLIEVEHVIREAKLSLIFAGQRNFELCCKASSSSMLAVAVVPLGEADEMLTGLDVAVGQCVDEIPPRASEAVCIVLYTSGSTGSPKGVAITDGSFTARLASFIDSSDSDATAVALVDSPLSVASATSNLMATLVNGGRVAIYPDLLRIFEVAKTVEPTALALVPELWALFHRQFLERELESLGNITALRTEFAGSLGRRIRNLSCGGARPNPAVMTWLREVFQQARVIENYGSTELGSVAWTTPEEGEGVIHSTVNVKLLRDDGSVYVICQDDTAAAAAEPPRGEICVKAPGMLVGYFNRPDLNDQAFTADGYFRTGDLGEALGGNRVRIVGRLGEVFKLSDGEFVCPASVENALCMSPFNSQAFVHGDSSMSFLVAIVVPPSHHATITEDRLLAEVTACCREAGLRPAHIPCAVGLAFEAFGTNNGLLTQSLKLCRPALRKHFAVLLRALMERGQQQKLGKEAQIVDNAARLIASAMREQPTASMEAEWSALPVDSLMAVQTADRVRRDFSVKVSVASLLVGASLATVARAALAAATPSALATPSQRVNVQQERASLGSLPATLPRAEGARSETLVTGATGFLGAAVLHRLLRQGRSCVALVRGDACTARDRLMKVMRQQGYWESAFGPLLDIIVGDISIPKLGLADAEKYDALALRLSLVLHCAAQVRHLAAYESLRSCNVGGCREVLHLAARAGCRIVHVSTLDCVPLGESEGFSQKDFERSGGYATSKWVAEGLVQAAGAAGLDVVVVRTGLLSFDATTGAGNMDDWLTRFVLGARRLGGVAIRERETITLHVTPVDFAASAIDVAARCAPPQAVWHIPCARLPGKSFWDAVAISHSDSGNTLQSMSDEDWLRCICYLPSENPLYPLKHLFLQGLPAVPSHRSEVASAVLEAEGLSMGSHGLAYEDLPTAAARYIRWIDESRSVAVSWRY
eukprot:TRINITY_DN38212_c0_g1_i1.p1 TRINITY_DN38212_c0_g1~~TRINITY_DN38212_c0_g1_i1.p1  ORF type:complete len:1372 (-),score=235.80 TRINITY_DN38212_c0_g1_i1:163-3702(-)